MSLLPVFIEGAGLMYNIFNSESESYQREQASKRQEEANQKAEQNARDQAEKSQQNINRANQKAPDISSILANNQSSSNPARDQDNTLASRQQLDSLLNLGGNSLLGMGLGNNNVRRR
jgi:sortase (surface protein transpeptidase)